MQSVQQKGVLKDMSNNFKSPPSRKASTKVDLVRYSVILSIVQESKLPFAIDILTISLFSIFLSITRSPESKKWNIFLIPIFLSQMKLPELQLRKSPYSTPPFLTHTFLSLVPSSRPKIRAHSQRQQMGLCTKSPQLISSNSHKKIGLD